MPDRILPINNAAVRANRGKLGKFLVFLSQSPKTTVEARPLTNLAGMATRQRFFLDNLATVPSSRRCKSVWVCSLNGMVPKLKPVRAS